MFLKPCLKSQIEQDESTIIYTLVYYPPTSGDRMKRHIISALISTALAVMGPTTKLVAQDFAIDLLSKGECHRDSSQWDSAIYYFDRAATAFATEKSWAQSIEAQLKANKVRIVELQYDKADSTLGPLLTLAKEKLAPGALTMAHVLDQSGNLLMKTGRYDRASIKLQEGLAIKKALKMHDDDIAHSYYLLGDAWRSMGIIDSAMSAYQNALKIREKIFGTQSKETAGVWSNIAILHRINGDFDKAINIYQKSDSINLRIFGSEHERRASTLNGMGIIYAQSARYPEALDCFTQLLKIDQKTQKKDSPLLAKTYTNLGILHELMGDLKTAQEMHKKSLGIKLKSFEPDNPNLIVDYQGLGVILSQIGDIDQALLYLRQVVEMELKAYSSNDPRLGTTYNMLASALEKKEAWDEALHYLGLAESIFLKHGESLIELGPLYHTIASIYAKRNQHDSALIYCHKALMTNQDFQKEHPNVAGNHLLMGNLLVQMNNLDSADMHYREALRINHLVHGDKHIDVATAHSKVGSVLATRRAYEEALREIQFALRAVTDDFREMDYHHNPIPAQTMTPRTVAIVLGEKGEILEDYAAQEDNEEMMKLALSTFDRAIDMIDAAQFSYKASGSVAKLKEELDPIYEHAISAAHVLFHKTDDQKYLEQAFRFSEKNKAALLVAAINETRAKEFSGLPIEILEKENNIKRNLTYYEQQLLGANHPQTDSTISEIQHKLFVLHQQYDNLIHDIEKNYPQYYKLKYESKTIEIERLQKAIPSDEVFIEYFLGRDHIYAFLFGQRVRRFVKIEIEAEFPSTIRGLRSAIADVDSDEKEYEEICRRLYRTLISPLEYDFSNEKITIVTDGELGYIPFEILIADGLGDPSSSKRPYLFLNHAVSYAYSATLEQQLSDQENSHKQTDLRYLAFAPDFNGRNENGDADIPNFLAHNQMVRGRLLPLLGAKREVESLNQQFEGDFYYEQDAQESTFKKIASQYGIIHLATHAIIDDINPLNSRLLFTIMGDSLDDGNLYAWELFGMDLNAKLAVLSACNTGFGKIQKGEGVQSLGRAFAYAGCPSRLMSLWPSQDASTADIMINFYRYLAEGFSKDEALRKAKITYLENAPAFSTHPFYWAGFILQGDPSPLVESTPMLWYVVALSMIVYLVVIVFFKTKRRRD